MDQVKTLDLKRVGPSPNAKSRRGKTGGNNEEDTEQKKKKQTRPGGRLRDTAATAGGRWSSGGNLGEVERWERDFNFRERETPQKFFRL